MESSSSVGGRHEGVVEKSEGGGEEPVRGFGGDRSSRKLRSWTCKDRKGVEGVSVREEGEESWSIFMKASCLVRLFKS